MLSRNILPIAAAMLLAVPAAYCQTAQPARARLIGLVTGVDAAGKGLTLKTDDGVSHVIVFLENTRLQKVAPGEKDLTKAESIKPQEIVAGDRVLVRGVPSADGKVLTAQQLVLMTSEDLEKKQQDERAQWQKRGSGGIVAAKDAAAKTLTLRIPGLATERKIEVTVTDKTKIRRYAPDSIKFSDAKPSDLATIGVGDQVRVLGDKNADGTKVTAEELVSGSFQTIAGTVVRVEENGSGFVLKNMAGGKEVTVKTTSDTVLKRMPKRGEGGGPMGGGMMGGGMMGGGMMGGGAPGGGRPGGFDLQHMLEFLPQIKVGELQTGETVLIASTKGSKPDETTAITLLAGAETLMAMRQAAGGNGGQRQRGDAGVGGSWSLEMPMMLP